MALGKRMCNGSWERRGKSGGELVRDLGCTPVPFHAYVVAVVSGVLVLTNSTASSLHMPQSSGFLDYI